MNGNEVPETGQIIASALRLPIVDRISLVNAMLESVEKSPDECSQSELKTSWEEEIAVRIEDIKSGNVDAVSSSDMWKRVGGKPNGA